MKDIIDLLARMCLATIFVYEAYDSLFFFKSTKETMTSYGITFQQNTILTLVIGALVLGGLLILLGYRTKLGAILLLFYFIPVTFMAHDFWNFEIDVRRVEAISFMKNLGIIGGLLMVYVHGTGKYSVRRILASTKV